MRLHSRFTRIFLLSVALLFVVGTLSVLAGRSLMTGQADGGYFQKLVKSSTAGAALVFNKAVEPPAPSASVTNNVVALTPATPPQKALQVPIGVFVRPGGTSYSFTIPTDNSGATLQDIGFQNITVFGWILTRAGIQSSTDGGANWTPYTIQNNMISAFLPVSGRIFRVVDTMPGDTTTTQNFGNAWHLVSTPGSTSASGGYVIPDNPPTDLTADRTTVFDTLPQGSTLATVTPVDTGAITDGWWVLESQSVPNLFAISFNRTVDNKVALTKSTGTMPAIGSTVSATLRYFDIYQTDSSGNPISGQGFSKTLNFTVTSEVSNDLTFGNDIAVNTFTTNNQSAPSVAQLSNGNLAVVWQSASQGGKSPVTNSGIYGQLLSSTGAMVGAEFIVSNAGAGVDEIAPAVTALAGGRYVVAYSKKSGADYDIAFRIVESNGAVGSQIIANSTTAGDQSAPSITTLTDGSFVIAWYSSNGEIRARQFAAAAGAAVTGEVLFDSAGFYTAVAALSNGSYAVAWVDNATSEVEVKVNGGSVVGTGITTAYFAGPRLAGLTGGGFVLASESYNSVTMLSQIEAVRYNNSGVIQGAKFQANTVSTGNRYGATVAALTGGGFAVGWTADNGDFDLNGIFGRRFTSSGTAVDASDFEINQHRNGDQAYPAMTAMSSDAFATVWTDTTAASINAGAYAGDIEARILVIAPPVSPPTVAKTFNGSSSATVVFGETGVLGFSINNPNAGTNLTGIGFTDSFPAGINVANTSGSITAGGGFSDGTYSVTGNVLTVSGVTVAAASSRTLTLFFTGAQVGGPYTNTIASVSSTNGGTNNTPSTATITVNKANTTATVAAGTLGTATVVGESYSVSASVSVTSPGAGTPAGTITVSDGSQTCTITLPATSCNLTSTTVGAPKTITATYGGNANFNASPTSSGVSHTVNKASTTTTVSAGTLGTPTVVGQSYPVSASVAVVSPGSFAPDNLSKKQIVLTPGPVSGPTGSITVSDGSATCTITLPSTSCNLTSTTAGAKTITASYAGDSNYNGSTSSGVSHTVNAANTTTTITNSGALGTASTVGQAYAVNWSVTVNSPGAVGAALSGNVTVSDGSQTCTAAVSAGTCNLTSTTTGAKTITVTYAGDTNYNTSTSTGVSHQVNGAATTTTIDNAGALATATVTGESYQVQASVTSGAGTPTGTITVSDGTGATCSILLPATSCSLTSTTIGTKTITASYGGDANLATSTSTGVSHTVNKASTTTTVSAGTLGTATVVGQSYSVSASVAVVSPGSFAPTGLSRRNTPVFMPVMPVSGPTGNITVSDGSATCTITLPATSCNLTSTTAGVKNITATYAGDSNYLTSVSSGVSHTVNAVNTTTTITNAASLNSTPTVVGQAYAVNWSVTVNSPGAVGAALTGNVTVSDGSQTCTAAVSAGTCNLTSTTTGAKSITATYAGDANYTTSTSSNAPHTVSGAATTTIISNSVALSGAASVVGQSYSVSASVTVNSPGTGTPTGTVNVSDGTGGTCSITLSAGSGSCNLTSTTAGAKTITATYAGDSSFNTSSGTASHTVNKADTTLSGLSDAPDPSVVGQLYTAGFTLNITAPGAGTPTGTVSVDDGAGGTCTATLPATSCQLTSTVAGNKTVTFTYNGDANFNASPSNTAGHAVNKANTTVAITNDTPDPSVIGQNYAVTAAVSVTSPGSGAPTGTITVTDGTNNCTITLPATSCNLPSTSVGAKTLTATYNGDANFNASAPSAGAPHTVNKADTVTTITSDNPDSSSVGQNVTVAFTVVAAAPGAGTPSGNVVVTVSGGSETCTGTVAAGSCVISLTTPGARTLTATYAGDTIFNGGNDTEPHTVVAPPSIAKSFSPTTAQIGATTTLTLTITNPAANTVALTGVGVTDTFPGGLVVATPLTTNNTCGGTLTDSSNNALIAGATSIKLAGGTVNISSTCTVSVNVTPTAQGPLVNTTGNVSSTNGGTGNTATATLLTNSPPTITSNTISINAGSSAASFTIGTVFDADQAFNTLSVAINGGASASSNGVTVNGLAINPNGIVTANVAATCAATSATFNLVVTDNQSATGTGTLTVTVIANTPPVLSYNPTTVTAGTTPTITPAAGPSDNGAFTIGSVSVSPNNGGLGVLLNQSNGVVTILGAFQVGTYTVTVPITDNCNATTTATLTINVVCPTITISPSPLPNAAINTAYPQTISAAPAGGNYTFAVTSGLLPTGLTLNSNGSFSGAPTQSGTFNFRVTATGFAGPGGSCTAFTDYTLVVSCQTITISPSSLPGGTIGTAYNQTVSASPAGTYSYSVTSGALPTGLTLNGANGALTGTPAASGTYNFTISASANGCSGSQRYTVVIACSTISITTTSLPGGQAGVSYSQTLNVTPAGSYSFAIATGSLPSGLVLNTSAGVISGLPSVTGTYNFTVRAQAAGGCNTTQAYSLTITCPAIALAPSSLPNGATGTAYSQLVSASPAGGNYSFAVASGSLPSGLLLNTATGLISGTPSASGTSNFTITAIGFGGCTGSQAYSITIGGGACPAITLPSSLPNGTVGSLYSNSVGASPADSYSYTATGTLPPGLTLFGSFGLIFGYPTTPGTYNFTVTATLGSCTGSQSYAVVIGLGFLPNLLPDATIGRGYSQRFKPLGTSGSAVFTKVAGDLPQGVTLAADGTLSGTPTQKGSFPVTLRVSDPVYSGSQNITLQVNDNSSPVVSGSIVDPLNCTRSGSAVNVTATLANTSGATQTANFTATLPAQLLALPGSCTTNVAGFNCQVVNGSTVTASGTLTNNQSVTITYQAQIADGVPAGAQVCVTSTASFVGAATATVAACTTLNCPTTGPGIQYPAASPWGDQKAGSVLIYNIYTSATDPTRQNTRLSITNTDTARSISVHLFFVDGASCSIADSYICLTQNQTASFLASDLDPGTTGYVIAVATDVNGCPTNFNFLIGDEYVKFSSGHAANLAAEAIAALPGGLAACNTNSTTAAINFDGISYNTVPRALALDNVGSRADGNDTLLILNRIGGNLATGASTLGTVFGILYDDSENGLSFSVTGSCQLRNSLSNTFPRTTPRFENFIPAGRSGWLKVFSQSDIGLSGAAINFNPNAGTSAGAFNQGHNLHTLTNTSAATYTIPVFPPGC